MNIPKEVKEQVISEYGRICIFGGTISKKNILTLHHIIPVRSRKYVKSYEREYLNNKANLVPIGKLEHDLYHFFEHVDSNVAGTLEEYMIYFQLYSEKVPEMLESRKDIHRYMLDKAEYYGLEIIETKEKIIKIRRKPITFSKKDRFKLDDYKFIQ